MPLKSIIQKELIEADKKVEMLEKIVRNYALALEAINSRVIEDAELLGTENLETEYDLIVNSLIEKNDKLADRETKEIMTVNSFKCSEVYTIKNPENDCGYAHAPYR